MDQGLNLDQDFGRRRRIIHKEGILQKHLRLWVREAIDAPHEFFGFDRSSPSARFTHMRERARGIRKGTPDSLLLVPSLPPIWCELKAPGKRPDEAQEDIGQRLKGLGNIWFWCSSIAKYRLALGIYGVPMRANAEFLALHHDAAITAEIEKAQLNAGRVPKRMRVKGPKPSPARVRRARAAGVLA